MSTTTNSRAEQQAFPFPSIDFEGFTVLTVDQIAKKLRWSSQHILNLVEQGDPVAIDGRSANVTRRNCRITIEAYRAWVIRRMTGPFRHEFIRDLPRHVRIELIQNLTASLKE